ncbi:MAG: aconitate hydratase AcnA [Desulfobacteraceae bacterium]|nr:MAG: aconitate hydratase AcnA [Desulfobacteraceae bacterium]
MKPSSYEKAVSVNGKEYQIVDVKAFGKERGMDIYRLPFSIRILLENLLRKFDGRIVRQEDVMNIADWKKEYPEPVEIPYHPARVLMQDFTGVPAVVDLAVMRDAMKEYGGDPERINPSVPVDLIVDHSIQVDFSGSRDSLEKNVQMEYLRNSERYSLLKWAQNSFHNFRVVPPNSGICHQVNLEYLARIITVREDNGKHFAFPDTLVGTDSHTTMINGIGVLGWGVGGIEAEAVMLGQPYYMAIPEVIGVKLVGRLGPDITATDLVLTVTELLRKHRVVEKFVEFFGPGLQNLTVPDRATIANMSPEYGATMGFFPVDSKTIEYFIQTNRKDHAAIVEACAREMGLFHAADDRPEYTKVIELDLASIERSVAGPSRPQDRIGIPDLKTGFLKFSGRSGEKDASAGSGECVSVRDGSVVIAAITSCTNTSNPAVMIGAGLLARKAVLAGLRVPSHVKTSLAPGSRVVNGYLEHAGLLHCLEDLGFHLAAFGCTTCIGNSGPLHPDIDKQIRENNLTVASVLSGNRNFEARIHQRVKANYLMSPILVVAFALAGRIDIDFSTEPVAKSADGVPVYLRDIWPDAGEIADLVRKHVLTDLYEIEYNRIFDGDSYWNDLAVPEGKTFGWEETSTYIRKPPYFDQFEPQPHPRSDIQNARVLLMLGDTVTTDHISPAGAIPQNYPAGKYLVKKGVPPQEFNSYGSRRGNHEVMMRGTFANIRIRNLLAVPREGGYTQKFPEEEEMFVYAAGKAYEREGTPVLVIAGKEYGTGSSRDWAAKGSMLLGVQAVLAESYERIHRSNLIGMGILPLTFREGENAGYLGLDGKERYSISGIEGMTPRKKLQVAAVKEDGQTVFFQVIARLDTEIEVAYFEHGGILPYVLRKFLKEAR